MSTEFDELKKIVTGILVSSPLRLTIGHIDRDYAELIGERIPFRKFGFTSLEGCLHSMRDILEVCGSGPRAEVILYATNKSSHINELVTRQKITKSRRFGGKIQRGRRQSNIPPRFQNTLNNYPVPLMSICIPQNFQNYHSFKNNPGLPERSSSPWNPKAVTKNSIPKNDVQHQVVNDSNIVKQTTVPVRSDPISSTSSGTVPKQASPTNNIQSIDSDISDTECIYLSDTDDENDGPFLNTTEQNIHYITQEHIYDEDEESNSAISSYSCNYANNIPSAIQNNLIKLISQYEDGIWCGALPEIYKKMFKKELDYAEYGYRSLISLCMDLQDIFYCIRPDTGDFKLYDKKKQLPKDYNKSIKISQIFKHFKDFSDKPSTEPAVIDVEGDIVFIYPENTLELHEQIPKQFLPHGKQENDYIDVVIGEVYDPSKFWLLLDEYSEQLDKLMDDLQCFYTSVEHDYTIPNHMVKVGLYCAALYNKEYHRAIIVNTIKSVKDKVKVYYVDYGTVCAVEPSTLKFLHRKFSDLPQQAIRARLASIYPPTEKTQWPCETATRFLELVTMKTLVAHIHRIDPEREIVEVFLVDTSGEDDVYMNDTLVEEGHAIFTSQEQLQIELEPQATPWVKYIHLFPTFLEIEHSAVPSSAEMVRLQKIGIPLEQIYPRYYKQENLQDQLLSNDLKNTDSIDQDTVKKEESTCAKEIENQDDATDFLDVTKDEACNSKDIIEEPPIEVNNEVFTSTLICTKPPPGYESVQPSTAQLPQQTSVPNFPINPYVPLDYLQQVTFLQQQQMYYSNAYAYQFNPYYANSFNHERQTLQNMLYQFIIQNAYAQCTLTNYLIQQRQWQYTYAPNQIYAYLSTILNTIQPISVPQKNYLFREVINALTNIQMLDVLQALSESASRSHQQDTDSMLNSFSNLNLNSTNNVSNKNDTSQTTTETEDNSERVGVQKNQNLIAETDFHNKKVYLIWYSQEPHVNVEEILQLISSNIPIENIRKQIVMMDPTISIIDLPLINHQGLHEELLRYKKNVDKNSVLHIVPISSLQKVLSYLGSTLDVSAFLSKVTVNTDKWFKNEL